REREACAACHAESFCLRCHDGATRPQEVHPNDFISLHPVAARQAEARCDACHRRQSFCAGCHERTGVGSEAAAAFRDPTARVHPPAWLNPGAGHHGIHAARGIGACASCHREEQCAACHAATTLARRTHPPGFAERCRDMIRRSDRACAKCHVLSDPGDAAARCR
ncbi:MAG TPA: cytochrome C, partial [Anaeromyxobacteraceae bacterium]